MKYKTDGTKLWTRLSGTTARDESYGMVIDTSNNIYISGYTPGNLDGQTNAGGQDIFLIKYLGYGSKVYTIQTGTSSDDKATGIFTDNNGNIYITGYSSGNLDGQTNAGGKDVFVMKYLETYRPSRSPTLSPTPLPTSTLSPTAHFNVERSVVFSYTGSLQTYTVPNDITSISVKLWGAGGGAATRDPSYNTGFGGGSGGYAECSIQVTPGETLDILVGGSGGYGLEGINGRGGYGGGAEGVSFGSCITGPGGGGGRSSVRRNNDDIVTAGGLFII